MTTSLWGYPSLSFGIAPSGVHVSPPHGFDVVGEMPRLLRGAEYLQSFDPHLPRRLVVNTQAWPSLFRATDGVRGALESLSERHNMTIALKTRIPSQLAIEVEPEGVRRAQAQHLRMAATADGSSEDRADQPDLSQQLSAWKTTTRALFLGQMEKFPPSPPDMSPRQWREQLFKALVLEPLNDCIDSVSDDPLLQTTAFFDAVLAFPKSLRFATAFVLSEEMRSTIAIAERLGIAEGERIPLLSSAELQQLYRNIRWIHEVGHLALNDLFLKVESPEGLRQIAQFLAWFHDLDDDRRQFFAESYDVSALDLIGLLERTRQFEQANTTEGLRKRLLVLPRDEAAPLLVRLAVPVLLEELTALSTPDAPLEIQRAVLGCEQRAARGTPELPTARERGEALADDLFFLTHDLFSLYGDGRESHEGRLSRQNNLTTHLLNLPPFLWRIVRDRIAAEAGHPHAEVRLLQAAAAVRDIALHGDVEAGISALAPLWQDRSRPVRLTALNGSVLMLRQLELDSQHRLLERCRLYETCEKLLQSTRIADILEALSFLDRSWSTLPATVRTTLLDAVARVIDQHPEKTIATNALFFLSQHSGDLSAERKEDLGRRQDIQEILLRGMVSGYATVVARATQALPFYLRIAAKETRRAYGAWLEEEIGTLRMDRGRKFRRCSSVVAECFIADAKWGFFSAEGRKSLLELIATVFLAESEMALHLLERMVQHATSDEIEKLGAWIAEQFMGDEVAVQVHYLLAIASLSPRVKEWQRPSWLVHFLSEEPEEERTRVITLASGLPRRHLPILFQTLLEANFSPFGNQPTQRGGSMRQLIRHLIAQTKTIGQFTQVVLFFRDLQGLDWKLRWAFIDEVIRESSATVRGQQPVDAVDANDPRITEPPLHINPVKAQSRLRTFLANVFIDTIAEDPKERNRLRADLHQREALWQRRGFLSHLTSLASFSHKPGIASIRGLVNDLTSEASQAATRAVRNRRLRNPGRYASMEGAFALDYIKRWGNDDNDRVIPLGELDPTGVLADDPMALRRAKANYAIGQIANHLGASGASHLQGLALVASIRRRLERAVSPEQRERPAWFGPLSQLIDKIGRYDAILEVEVELALDLLNKDPELRTTLGNSGMELISDLRAFKQALEAPAVIGKAWLIVTSDPALFIGSGRDPVTCQDPTRHTGFNCNGQPSNRAREGRFLYAQIVVADDVTLIDGVAQMSSDGTEVGRLHLETTPAVGQPDPTARPHLLGERLYAHPGFIYADQVATGINRFAREHLELEPTSEVHLQFTSQGMDRYPRPLNDAVPIYRDTFR